MLRNLLLIGIVLGLPSCKQRASWYGEGTEGAGCFPDQTCDPGLVCLDGVCVTETPPPDPDLSITPPRDDGPYIRPDWPPFPDLKPPVDQVILCAVTPAPPSVTSYPKATAHLKVAVSGLAPGAKQVQVSGGVMVQTAFVSGGTFCIEVLLKPETTNTLQLISIDQKGCKSTPIFIDIQHSFLSTVTNLALGVTPKAKEPPDQGQLSSLSDGQLSPTTRLGFYDVEAGSTCDASTWLWWNLGGLRSIGQVTVKYPKKTGFKNYLDCWELLVSSKLWPTDPDPKHPDWTSLKASSNGTASDLTIVLNAVQAQHVALLMYEDGATGWYETFELAEVEIWGKGDPPPPPTCP